MGVQKALLGKTAEPDIRLLPMQRKMPNGGAIRLGGWEAGAGGER